MTKAREKARFFFSVNEHIWWMTSVSGVGVAK